MSSQLFSPMTIRGVEFRNRAWVSPMCQYSADNGKVGEWHRAHHAAFATGGAGLIMVEATGVNPKGRISIDCPGLWSDELAEAFRPIIDFSHQMGAKMGIQLAHAGRKGSTNSLGAAHHILPVSEGGWVTEAPSAIAFEGYPVPHAMTIEEIHATTADFVAAAKRAVHVGFDVLEIHAAHGYLLHEFLSPLSNQREDEYGGDFDNRTRFLREVASKIRAGIPDSTPLFVRISATDWVEGGWDLHQSIRLAHHLKDIGVDLIDVSTGGNITGVKIPLTPGYQVHFAEAIRKEADIKTSAVGLITEAHQAEEIIANHRADAVMLGRAMLRNPRWPLNAADDLGIKLDYWPKQLERARSIH